MKVKDLINALSVLPEDAEIVTQEGNTIALHLENNLVTLRQSPRIHYDGDTPKKAGKVKVDTDAQPNDGGIPAKGK